MSFGGPNLAREPFVNARPVRRAAATLWIAAIALLAWNALAYVSSGAGAAGKADELERLRAATRQARTRAETLETDLRRADLERGNQRTGFLNRRIAERAFSWNLLLDRLIETMPRGVRLLRLSPEGFREERTRRGTEPAVAPAERTVALQIEGDSEDDESMLEFVDRMFAHPAFERPNLSREMRTKTGGLGFSIAVAYRPAADLAPAGASAAALSSGAVSSAPGTTPASRPGGAVAAAPGSAVAGAALPAPALDAGLPAAGGPAVRAASPPARGERPELAAGGVAAPPEAAVAAPIEAPARPAPAPRASIFGGPAVARPYASGGGR